LTILVASNQVVDLLSIVAAATVGVLILPVQQTVDSLTVGAAARPMAVCFELGTPGSDVSLGIIRVVVPFNCIVVVVVDSGSFAQHLHRIDKVQSSQQSMTAGEISLE